MDYNEYEYRSKRSQLSFMYDTISMAENKMRAWLRVPEFVFQVHDLMNQGFEIDNDLVLDVAIPILVSIKERVVKRETLPSNIWFGSLKGGVNQLIRVTGRNGGKNVGRSWGELQAGLQGTE